MDETRRERINELLKLSGSREYRMPDNWRANFLKVLHNTDSTPTEAAEFLNIPWVQIKRHIRGAKDHDLEDEINLSRDAYFEKRLECPTEEDRRSAHVMKMQLQAFTKLISDNQDATPLDSNQIERLREERKAMVIEVQRLEQLETLKEQKLFKENQDG